MFAHQSPSNPLGSILTYRSPLRNILVKLIIILSLLKLFKQGLLVTEELDK